MIEQIIINPNEEIWKDIQGYEGLYQVGNKGRVRALDRHITQPCCFNSSLTRIYRGHEVVQRSDDRGYRYVSLSKNNHRKSYQVHRLVAMAFIPNPQKHPIINHKDENPSNNKADNLEWCSHKYNMNYGTCRARISLKMRNHPVLSKRVAQYDKMGNILAVYPSTREAGRAMGKDCTTICACCIGKRKTAYGFVWKYSE